jgi:Uma2 family endonuclease
MNAPLSQRRFTVDEFQRIGEAGILDVDERVELLDGQIIQMAPIGSRHAACVRRLNRLLGARIPSELVVDVQNPVRMGRDMQLIPDLAVLQPRGDFYDEGHPRPGDVLLVIEVADTTMPYDRNLKIPRYGRAGIREAWLVNLPDRCIEVFYNPSPESGYAESVRLDEAAALESTSITGLSVKVSEFLG